MTDFIKPVAEWSSAIVEILGIVVIILLALYSIIIGIKQLFRKKQTEMVFRQIRQILGRGILLGLEFLVAADIIHTVAVELTFKTVGVLAIIVLIRTFLSFSLEVELSGQWPWNK